MKQVFCIVLLFFVFSCKKDSGSKIIYTQWPIIKVEGAKNGSINQSIPITVFWPYGSGSCDVLDKFDETKQSNMVLIKAYGHSSAGICTMDAGIKTKIYNFIPTAQGNYELRFMNSDNSYISHEVTIN